MFGSTVGFPGVGRSNGAMFSFMASNLMQYLVTQKYRFLARNISILRKPDNKTANYCVKKLSF